MRKQKSVHPYKKPWHSTGLDQLAGHEKLSRAMPSDGLFRSSKFAAVEALYLKFSKLDKESRGCVAKAIIDSGISADLWLVKLQSALGRDEFRNRVREKVYQAKLADIERAKERPKVFLNKKRETKEAALEKRKRANKRKLREENLEALKKSRLSHQ